MDASSFSITEKLFPCMKLYFGTLSSHYKYSINEFLVSFVYGKGVKIFVVVEDFPLLFFIATFVALDLPRVFFSEIFSLPCHGWFLSWACERQLVAHFIPSERLLYLYPPSFPFWG